MHHSCVHLFPAKGDINTMGNNTLSLSKTGINVYSNFVFVCVCVGGGGGGGGMAFLGLSIAQ